MDIQPIKHVSVGLQFTGVTHMGRHIALGKVVRIEPFKAYPHHVVWFDENGKHYENFNLHDPAVEFREFDIIINSKEETRE